MKARIGLCLVVSVAFGCNPNTGGHDVTPTDSGGDTSTTDGGTSTVYPAPYTALTFTPSTVRPATPAAPAGYQGKLLRGPDGTLYYAYFHATGTSLGQCPAGQPPDAITCCDIARFSTGGAAPGINYWLEVGVLAPGASAWSIETVPLNQIVGASAYVTNRYGLEGTIDAQGRAVLVFAGGLPSTSNCGSSDLVVATRTGVATWSVQNPVTDSTGCCAVPDCPNGGACAMGDVVGLWAAATIDGDGNLVSTFMDYHYYWDLDGQTYPGLELWGGGTPTGIEPWSGRGKYAQLRWLQPKSGSTFSGLMSVYTSKDDMGLFVTRRKTTTGHVTDWERASGLTTMRDLISGGQIGERPSLAVAPDGTVGVALYLMADAVGVPKQDLVYCYSTDNGDHWVVPCENVDTTNTVGEYPSLAYDKKSRPMISYYYCGAGGNCTPEGDALRLAWRDDVSRKWLHYVAYADAGTKAGLYSQLVVDPTTDEPTITFQDTTRGAAMVVRGHLTGGN